MATSYDGVLTGDRIVWANGAKPPDGPVRVEAVPSPQPQMSDEERSRRIRELLEGIAARGNINATEWERERLASRTRKDPRDG